MNTVKSHVSHPPHSLVATPFGWPLQLKLDALLTDYPALLQAFGWGSLVVAAGVSFYFAKKSINERRREQYLSGSRPTEVLDCELC